MGCVSVGYIGSMQRVLKSQATLIKQKKEPLTALNRMTFVALIRIKLILSEDYAFYYFTFDYLISVFVSYIICFLVCSLL